MRQPSTADQVEKTRVAIVGAGFMGGTHGTAYQQLRDRARVTYVCDVAIDRATSLAAILGADATADFETAMRGADVVDVCVPTRYHPDVATQALRLGKDVFLEKPIALDTNGADAILRSAEKARRLLMVGHVLRFWPGHVAVHEVVERGELGRPLGISTSRLSPPAGWNNWMRDPQYSGGIAVDLLIHDFDQMNWYFGQAERVFASSTGSRGSGAQHVLAVVEYASGVGLADGGMAMPTGYLFTSSIRVLCSDGAAEYEFRSAPAAGGGNFGPVSSAVPGARIFRNDGSSALVALSSHDPFVLELEYFLDCVRSRRAPERADGYQARDALVVAQAINRALDTGRPQRVKPR